MIQNDEQMRRTHEALLLLLQGVSAVNQKKDRLAPKLYDIMLWPWVEDVVKLRGDIDAYLGIPEAQKTPRWFSPEAILERLRARPFQPFRLRAGKEQQFEVHDPELVRVAKDGVILFTANGDGEVYESAEKIPIGTIWAIEPLDGEIAEGVKAEPVAEATPAG